MIELIPCSAAIETMEILKSDFDFFINTLIPFYLIFILNVSRETLFITIVIKHIEMITCLYYNINSINEYFQCYNHNLKILYLLCLKSEMKEIKYAERIY